VKHVGCWGLSAIVRTSEIPDNVNTKNYWSMTYKLDHVNVTCKASQEIVEIVHNSLDLFQ
jgi:hypothetical protein